MIILSLKLEECSHITIMVMMILLDSSPGFLQSNDQLAPDLASNGDNDPAGTGDTPASSR